MTIWVDNGPQVFSLYTCPVTEWQYFYALIPTEHLKNDIELQPRTLDKTQCGDYTGIFSVTRHWRLQSAALMGMAPYCSLTASTRRQRKSGRADKQLSARSTSRPRQKDSRRRISKLTVLQANVILLVRANEEIR